MVSYLLCLLHPLHLFLSCRAGSIPRCMFSSAECAFGLESGTALDRTAPRLMSACAVAALLGSITLSTDVTVVIASEALLDSAGAVVELTVMD